MSIGMAAHAITRERACVSVTRVGRADRPSSLVEQPRACALGALGTLR